MYWHVRLAGPCCRGPHLQPTPANVPRRVQNMGGGGDVIGRALKLGAANSDRRDCCNGFYERAFTGKEKLKAHLNMLEGPPNANQRSWAARWKPVPMQKKAPGQNLWHPNRLATSYTSLQVHAPANNAAGGYVRVNTRKVRGRRKLWEVPSATGRNTNDHYVYCRSGTRKHAREKSVNALKPTETALATCQIFKPSLKSYRDLPLRNWPNSGPCNRL